MTSTLHAVAIAIITLGMACAPPASGPGDAASHAAADAGQPDAGAHLPCNGCLLQRDHIGDYAQATLQSVVDPSVTVENGYSVWYIRYTTDGREALATVTIPWLADAPPTGWHMVVNNHGTTGLDDPCALGFSVAGAGLAGTFGARGLIGVAPDLPGLGTAGLHPYLVSSVAGRASLDAARAALRLVAELEIPASGKVAIVGLSQGGHTALAAAAEHQRHAPELQVKAIAAAAPASMFLEQWASSVNLPGPHLTYHAMITYAWAQHYGHDGASPWAAAMDARIDSVMTTRCLFATTPTLPEEIGTSPTAIFSEPFLAAFSSRQFDGFAFMAEGFQQNRVRPFTQTAPIRIYQGSADDVVPPSFTQSMVSELRAGGMDVELLEVPGGSHTDVAFGFLAYPQHRTEESLRWLLARLDE